MSLNVWRAVHKNVSVSSSLNAFASVCSVLTSKIKATVLSLCTLVALALTISGCASLPEGAVAPTLTIDRVSINEQGNEPKFIVNFTLEHRSATALPLYSVTADIFIRDQKVATFTQSYREEQLPPNQKLQYRLEVPVNLVGQASLDSMLNNSLLMLQGSCALSATISPDPKNQSFNPSRSYYGLISVDNK